jgi:hypothetical protein
MGVSQGFGGRLKASETPKPVENFPWFFNQLNLLRRFYA